MPAEGAQPRAPSPLDAVLPLVVALIGTWNLAGTLSTAEAAMERQAVPR